MDAKCVQQEMQTRVLAGCRRQKRDPREAKMAIHRGIMGIGMGSYDGASDGQWAHTPARIESTQTTR